MKRREFSRLVHRIKIVYTGAEDFASLFGSRVPMKEETKLRHLPINDLMA